MRRSPSPKAIILAGGRGSRLRHLTDYIPKPMIEINGKPFLSYLLDFLAAQDVREAVLSIGYRAEAFMKHFNNSFGDIMIQYLSEAEPLGTGGAIKRALLFIEDDNILVMNGDTYFPIKLNTLRDFHESRGSYVTLALKPMKDTGRYGKVSIDEEGKVINMEEKGSGSPGLINGGVYFIRRDLFEGISLPDKFSFEVDFLLEYYHQKLICGLPFDDYFVDIGVPPDYERAKSELK